MDELSEVLISKVKSHPYLYDDQHKEYKNFNTKEQAWKKIGEELKLSPLKVKSRWKNLRDSYVKYKNQLKKVTDAASQEALNNRNMKWTGRAYLSFLDETLARRTQSVSNASPKSENVGTTPPTKRARSSAYEKAIKDNIKVNSKKLKKKSQSRFFSTFHAGTSRRRTEKSYNKDVQPKEDYSESETNTTEFGQGIDPSNNCLEISTTNGMVVRDNNIPLQMNQIKSNDADIIFHYLEEKRKCQTVNVGGDAVDHLFSSYAQTLRTLPLRQQVNIKIEMAKLFATAEIESQD